MHTTNTSSKLPFFGFGSTNGRDDNHNDKSNTSFYNKDSSIAALEAFQREYLPAVSYPGSISQRIPSSLSSSSIVRPGSPPSPGPVPRTFSSPGTGSLESFQHNHSFDEQFKDVSLTWLNIKSHNLFNFSALWNWWQPKEKRVSGWTLQFHAKKRLVVDN